jgi:hypothetical protein
MRREVEVGLTVTLICLGPTRRFNGLDRLAIVR